MIGESARDISIAICTRNRAASLARTLVSLTNMVIPSGLRWEVVIVNNGSSDETETVIQNFKTRLPVRGTFEPTPGLSNARNRALQEITSAYIIWTDDDVLVDENFLASYVEAFHAWPEASFFGGKIIPVFAEPTPAWLRECWQIVGGVFAFRDFGDEPFAFTLTGDRIPYGANFAVRTAEQRAYLYDPRLGPGGLVPGEETSVIARMIADGKSGYWVPKSKVLHCTGLERQTMAYVSGFLRRQGQAIAFQEVGRPNVENAPRFLGAPRWLWRRLVVSFCKFQIARWTGPPRKWIHQYKEYSVERGYFEFHRQQRRS